MALRADDDLIAVGDHVVHLYDDDGELIESVSRMLACALRSGDAAVAVATPAHLTALRSAIASTGIDLDDPAVASRYHPLDARASLTAFMHAGEVDGARFAEVIGGHISRAAEPGRAVFVFGEMVALLWDDDNVAGAIALEALWNDLAERLPFALYCAYRRGAVDGEEQLAAIKDICDHHGEVLTPARYLTDDAPAIAADTVERIEFFVPVPLAARAVRRFVAEALTAWDLAALVDDACIVASELATNALVHAGSPFHVHVMLRESSVRISVHDASTTAPAPREMVLEATNGRGMGLVTWLAGRSGSDIGAQGKVVWAELPTTVLDSER